MNLKIEGLDELRAALRALPAELAAEAGGIVLGAATAAERDMAGQYAQHDKTGNLSGGLSVSSEPGAIRYGARAVVRNRAPHALFAEHGTQVRQNAKGANRGAMPPISVFIPTAQRHRREMIRSLISLVESHGIKVSTTETDLA